MNLEHFQSCFYSFVFWWILYLAIFMLIPKNYFRMIRKSNVEEFHCRIVTLFHALLVATLSISTVFINRTWPFREPAGPNMSFQVVICTVSLGYFLFDLHWCLYHKTEDAFMLFHHFVSIACFVATFYFGKHGDEVTAILFATEFTNPLLQVRWFLLNVSINNPEDAKEPPTKKRKLSECDFEFVEGEDLASQNGMLNQNACTQTTEVRTYESSEMNIVSNRKVVTDAQDQSEQPDATQTLPKEKRVDIFVIDMVFFSMFTLMRVVLGTKYYISYLSSASPANIAKVGFTAIYFVGMVFWVRMVAYLLRNYFNTAETAQVKRN